MLSNLPRLVIATHNAHKTGEFRAMLGHAWAVEDLTAHPGLVPPEETGSTFEENAAIKSLAASVFLGPEVLVIADDSGLEVDALDGRPGVRSARYADGTDAGNREKVLAELAAAGVRGKERSARFRCVLSAACGGRELVSFSGAVEGILANECKGSGGFGYDPIFIPEGHCTTFGELSAETKNGISHRSRALALLVPWLTDFQDRGNC